MVMVFTVVTVMVVIGQDRSGVVRFQLVRVDVDLFLDFVLVRGDDQRTVWSPLQMVMLVQFVAGMVVVGVVPAVGMMVQDVELMLQQAFVILLLLGGLRLDVNLRGVLLRLEFRPEPVKVQDGVLGLEVFHQVVPVAIARALDQFDHLDELFAIRFGVGLLDALEETGDFLVQ